VASRNTELIRRFIPFYRPYRGLFALDMGTALFRSLLALCIPLLIRNMLKYDLPAGNMGRVWVVLGVAGALVALLSFSAYLNTRWGHVLGTRMEADMRSDLFRHLQKLSFSYYDKTKTGHLISRIANDLFNVAEMAHHCPEDIFVSWLSFVGAFIVMWRFSSSLALIALVPLPFMAVWGYVYGMRMRNAFRRVRERIADINSSVENSIQGIREVKSFTNEAFEVEKFGDVNTEFRSAKEGMYSTMAAFHGGMMFFMESYTLVIIGGGVFLAHSGGIDLADLIGFLLYVPYIMNPLRRFVNFIEQFQQGLASFERFTEVMDVEPDIVDRPGAVRPEGVLGEVEFEDVWFRYESSDEWALEDVCIHLPRGRAVALVGESGAGKSTLAALVPRFYEATRGRITIDGINVLDLQQRSLRENIGLVQQDVFLFDSTVRENILFGRPEATEEEMVEASRSANIYDFVTSLPEGFDTLVGERGVRLSGGQKQRVSIARVFLKNPPILIFDEATSSLDTESENLIRAAMEELCRGRTTLVIAHRLSTVQKADYTYVLRGGRVVEEGRHEDLLERHGYYSDLYAQGVL
jgi:ATP-binding cassette subfamily B protein